MQLGDMDRFLPQYGLVHAPFLQYRIQIWFFYLVIFGNSRIAPTISTKAFAKSKMYIDTNPIFTRLTKHCRHPFFPSLGLEALIIPKRYRGVAGVTGCGHIVL